eukprot:CAMPEP_0168224808 /NCGR_PEP_ID=MMETSP0140_2-20121125/12304_1 /TAXON_ID=44445 /ORGANISM="Pseudo-nitzschia australis, Strain 10249 10 AB" /LENGTH=220 /DNA_ID=CAMNT_0008155307 /DNA_START=147 /DNA_END=810 /DNA_ORIENTATION=+
MSGFGRGRGRGGGRGGGRGFGGRGGRGGGRFGREEGPPAEIVEIGQVLHDCESELVCRWTLDQKVPYFNAGVYLENKRKIGKVDEILGKVAEIFFTVKMDPGVLSKSFQPNDLMYIGTDKLLPIVRFTNPSALEGEVADGEVEVVEEAAEAEVVVEEAAEVEVVEDSVAEAEVVEDLVEEAVVAVEGEEVGEEVEVDSKIIGNIDLSISILLHACTFLIY